MPRAGHRVSRRRRRRRPQHGGVRIIPFLKSANQARKLYKQPLGLTTAIPLYQSLKHAKAMYDAPLSLF